jgi:predicted Zn finger-like uncharacterized protein
MQREPCLGLPLAPFSARDPKSEDMILTCPQCDTRYQADAAKFRPAGRNVRCAKCGHLWHQDAPPPEPDAIVDVAEPEPEPVPAPPPPMAMPAAPPRPQAFVPNPVVAREVPAPRGPSRWPARIALGFGWIGLAAVILLIGWSAMTFRRQIATIWPQSASLYSALGMKAQTSGLDIQNYASARVSENGQPVLVVSGTVANTGAHELPVPQLRAALTDEESRELYHWTFMPGVMTLKPGQSTRFRSRLTNPPGGGSHVELRFAKEGE